MPNHTSNKLTVRGSLASVTRIKEDFLQEDGTLDLNKVIPMPDALRASTSGSASYRAEKLINEGDSVESLLERADLTDEVKAALRCHQEFGHVSWYEWALANWGTKWGCYDGSACEIVMEDADSASLELNFLSAWSPPTPALEKLSELFPDCVLHLYALDEGGCFASEIYFTDGEIREELEWDWAQMDVAIFGHEPYEEYEDEADSTADAATAPNRNGRLYNMELD